MKTLFQLSEATKADQHHVTAFTRMNPPTTGHMQLIDKVHAVAKDHGADHSVVVSHSQDAKKNPLSSDQKKKHLKRFSSETNVVASSKEHPTILHHLSSLHKAGVTHAHIVAGSDRHDEMSKLTNAYNGKKAGHGYYKFKKITIHSAGERDPDAEGTSGISATKQREHAASGNFKEFRKGVPSHVSDSHTKDLMNDVKNGQKTKKNEESEMESLDNLFEEFMIEDSESFSDAELWNVVDQTSFSDLDPNENDSDFIETLVGESIEEDLDESRVLSILQRQRAKMKFKQRQPRMKRMRELKRKRMATPQRLTYRARTSALMMLRKRIAGQKGLSYHKLPPSQRYAIDKAVQARYGKNLDKLVGTLSKRTLPMIRKKEMTRLAKARGQNVTMPAQSKSLYQSYDVREDSDYISTNNDHLLTPKVNMLLRLGLVDQDEIEKYRRALKIGEKALSSPELRSKILSMLDKILKMATDDPQTFARMRAMVVLKKNPQNEEKNISKDPLENDPLEVDPLKINKMDPTPEEGHLTLRKKMIRQHESKTFASLREKIKDQYDPLAEDKIAESLYNKSVKYNVSIDAVVEVYEDALKDSGNENVAFDAVNSFLANRELDEVQRAADMKRIKVRLPDGRTVYRNERREDSVQDEEVEQMEEAVDKKDSVVMDIPLLIRVLELAREDLKSDMDLHKVVEKLINIRNKGILTMDDYDYIAHIKEQVELMDESHFKIGDKVKFKTSGMKGEVVKLDKEDGAEDEKYYTIKGEDGKMRKMAPKDMIKETEQIDEKHLVNVTISDPNHTMVSKRKETMQRRASVTAKDREHAIDIAIRHYKKQGYKVHDHQYVKEEVDADSIFEIEMYVSEIHEARGDHLLTIEGGRGKGRKFMHKDTSTDDHLSAMEFHLKAYHVAKKSKLEATKNHHAKMYHKHKDQIEALGGVGNHLKESNAHKILAKKIQQMAIRKKMTDDALARHNAEQEKAEKEKKQGVTEASTPYWKKLSFIKKMSQMAKQERREREKKEAEKKPVKEEGGAGEFGTPELTKKYAKNTPGQCQEILNMNTADMGDVIKDFKKSDAPQFKGKSVEKRRQMAIAAKLSSQDKE
jgi:heat shock protein HspQ